LPSDESITPLNPAEYQNYFQNLIERTSFSHFVELIKIEDGTKRKFFELIILKTTPSVQELKRQINTLAYERVGLSQDLDLATNQLLGKIEPTKVEDSIKNIYLFDFFRHSQQRANRRNRLRGSTSKPFAGVYIGAWEWFLFRSQTKTHID
jgi:hypothetical protein